MTTEYRSGLHATKADPDFHWTVKFFDERMKHVKTIRVKLHDVRRGIKNLPGVGSDGKTCSYTRHLGESLRRL